MNQKKRKRQKNNSIPNMDLLGFMFIFLFKSTNITGRIDSEDLIWRKK